MSDVSAPWIASAITWYTLMDGTAVLACIETWDEFGNRHTRIRWVPDRPYPTPQAHPMISLLELMAIASEGGMSVPKAGRRPPFSIGQRWRCDRSIDGKPSFDFLIVGRGRNDRHKLCALVPLSDADRVSMPALRKRTPDDPLVCEYSHHHLQKHAKLVET